MNLLIVDDQKDVQESLSHMLRSIPAIHVDQIFTAGNVPCARQYLKNEKIDTLLLDIAMDGEDGFCLLQTIQEQQYPVSVIMMTGYPEMNYALRAIEMHVDGFLLKPILSAKLQEVLLTSARRVTESQDQSALHLHCMLLDAYLQGVNMDINYKKISERTGLSAIREEYMLVMQADIGISAQMDNSQRILFGQVEQLFAHSLCYAPKPGRLVLIAGVENTFERISELESYLKECSPNFRAGCVIRPAAHGLGSLYRSTSWLLQHMFEEETKKLKVWDEAQLRRRIVESYIHRIQKSRTDREALNTVLAEILDVCTSCHLSVMSIGADLQACGLTDHALPQEKTGSMIRIRAALIDLLILDPDNLLPDKVTAMLEYINCHYAEKITLANVANAANINYTYASMLFKQYIDSSFTEYLQSVRMKAAKRLLRTTNCYTYEVAHRVGIPNEKYFIRQFKALYGMTPQAWRNGNEESGDA